MIPDVPSDHTAQERRILHDMIMLQSSLGIHDRPVTDVSQCTSSFFVHLADKYFGILSEIRKPDSHESKVYNISVIVRHLEKALAVKLPYIDPDAVARQDMRHVSFLLDVFVCLVEPPPSQSIQEWQTGVIPPPPKSKDARKESRTSQRPVSTVALADIDAKLAQLERVVAGLEEEGLHPLGAEGHQLQTSSALFLKRESKTVAAARRRVEKFVREETEGWRRVMLRHQAIGEAEDARALRDFLTQEKRRLIEMRKEAREHEKMAREAQHNQNESLRRLYDAALSDLQATKAKLKQSLTLSELERRREADKMRREVQRQFEEEYRQLQQVQRSIAEKKFYMSR